MRFTLKALVLLCSTLIFLHSNAYGEPTANEWNKDEEKVRRSVAAGEIAEFPEDAPGILSPKFLQALLSGSLKGSQGVKYILVKCARINGELVLDYQEIKPYVSLKCMIFEDNVNLSWSTFAKGLNLSYGVFKKNVTFRGMETQGPFRCMEAAFSGEEADIRSLRAHHVVDFGGASFQPVANFA